MNNECSHLPTQDAGVDRPWVLATLLASTVLLAACPMNERIWLEPNSTREHLVVLRGAEEGRPKGVWLYGFTVRTCPIGGSDSSAVILWSVRINDVRPAEYPSRIVYGEVPVGYTAISPAKAIVAKCIRVEGEATSVTIGFDSSGRASMQGSQ